MDLGIALEGFFFEKVNGSTGQRVTFTFHYIIYAPASCHTLQGLLLLAAAESNSAPFARRVLHCISTVYIGGPWGVLFLKGQRVDGSTGQWVKRGDGSNGSTAHISTVYVGGPRNCPWGVLFRKGQQVDCSTSHESNGSTGQRVTFTFTILYMIADDARLTPPRCKKHTAYDDTRLTPHLDG